MSTINILVFTDFIDLSVTTFINESWNGSGCSQIIPKLEVVFFFNSCEKLFYQPKYSSSLFLKMLCTHTQIYQSTDIFKHSRFAKVHIYMIRILYMYIYRITLTYMEYLHKR